MKKQINKMAQQIAHNMDDRDVTEIEMLMVCFKQQRRCHWTIPNH
jgi:hypothetical protein